MSQSVHRNNGAGSRGIFTTGVRLHLLILLFVSFAASAAVQIYPTRLGDVNGDGQIDVTDLALVVSHIQGSPRLSNELATFADVNQDGIVNNLDVDRIGDAILGLTVLPELPLVQLLDTSPVSGETGVGVTRETILRFTGPLATNTLLSTASFHAEFGGRRLLSRVELSSDRRKATLFYLEPLANGGATRENLPGSARVRVTFDGNAVRDFAGRPIDADGDGQPGGIAVIDFETTSLTPLPRTRVYGRVFASELLVRPSNPADVALNVPLAGVTVTVDGMEETMRAVTDQFGDFQLTNAPAGPFFVHLDGRTVTNTAKGIRWPDLAYYPIVAERWTSVPGEEVNIGEVYLPLVPAGTLKPVSTTEETVLTFSAEYIADHPEFAGVVVRVPPGSLYSDNGTRGGRIGISPVTPNRLPAPVPLGLPANDVITVQTDGPGNFDEPVPVCMPNFEKLPPGAKSALWSFNHDTGQWEVVGPMTVSEDGTQVCTDPGVGIRAPGWHMQDPGTRGCCGGDNGPGDHDECHGRICLPCRQCPCPTNTIVNPVNFFSGEKIETVTDLTIKGVGMDFAWTRTYRSKRGMNTAQGNGWDFSYNILSYPSGRGYRFGNGGARNELFLRGSEGTYSHNGWNSELRVQPDGRATMLFEDQKQLTFRPQDGSPAAGKIETIEDRNGNRLRFAYDGEGRLTTVIDTLDREITIAYNPQGYIESVTDFAGRSVRYAYYGDFDPGGSLGDLKSVTTPAVVGTPNGNDFPEGKTTLYTYSKGYAVEGLNHNLLTITDGRGNTYLQNVYNTQVTNPDDPLFDRVIRQIRGGDFVDLTYVPQPPEAEGGLGYMKVIIHDRDGNVLEHFYDAGNRLVRKREYTGRADPTRPTTETENRPTGRLRPEDPEFFETRYEYNAFYQITRTIHPNGNITENVYESDLNPAASPRTRNNVRMVRSFPGSHLPAGDQEAITESFEYDTDFGGCAACGFNFVTKHTDGRGNVTLSQYDSRGNLVARTNRIASVVEEFAYNDRGQKTRHVHPDNGSGSRRIDTMAYYDAGPQKGYLAEEVVDSGGFNLTTRYEYDRIGNVVRRIDPRGHDTRYVVNQLDQVVREISAEVLDGSGIRYVRDFHFDANNNLVRTEVENRRELLLADGAPFRSDLSVTLGFPAADGGVVASNPTWSTVYEYEILNNLVRKSEEVEPGRFVVTEYGYNRNRIRTLIRHGEATAGRQTNNVVLTLYDERNMPFREVRGWRDAGQSTTQFDYDGNGNRIRVSHGLEDRPHVTRSLYDGYDRLVAVIDPMGNVTTNSYDANGNRTRTLVFGELNDVPGDAGNVRLRELAFVYDPMNRLTEQAAAFFNATNQVPIGDGVARTRTLWADDSMVYATINANGHGRTNVYDTANRLHTVIDAKGNTLTYDRDGNGNVTAITEVDKSDLASLPPTPFPKVGTNGTVEPYVPQPAQLGLDETFVTTHAYDNLDRLVASTDGAGNVSRSGFDSRHNRTLSVDALTNVVHIIFDGLNRELDTIREMEDRVGVPPMKPTLSTRKVWDDSSRLVQEIDDNSNATTYLFDPLNRKYATVFADHTGQTNRLDVHGDAVVYSDANGNRVTNRYDDLDRLVRRDVQVGPGVSDDTTWEDYRYDGLSRLTYAADDDSVVNRNYDSLGHVRQDIQGTNVVRALYDAAGNQTELHYPSGRRVVTTYDSLERKARITDRVDGVDSLIAEYYYVGPSRVTRRDYGNGTISLWQYDGIQSAPNVTVDQGFQRITRTTYHRARDLAVLDDRTYTWDRLMNKTAREDVRAGGTRISRDYRYDAAYRLVRSRKSSAAGQIETITYNLDGVGNRVLVVGGTGAGDYTMDATMPNPGDRQVNAYTTTPSGNRIYHENGSLSAVAIGTELRTAWTYDFADRLVGVTNSASTEVSVLSYDALGRRISKESANGISRKTDFVYYDSQEIEERERDRDRVIVSIRGLTAVDPLYGGYAGNEFYLYGDASDNVVLVCDPSAAVTVRYDYADYGVVRAFVQDGTTQESINRYLLSGQRFDDDLGLYFMRTRYLDPVCGVFLTRDSLGIWGDYRNLGSALAYVGANPESRCDPFGQAASDTSGNKTSECKKKCRCEAIPNLNMRTPQLYQKWCDRVLDFCGCHRLWEHQVGAPTQECDASKTDE